MGLGGLICCSESVGAPGIRNCAVVAFGRAAQHDLHFDLSVWNIQNDKRKETAASGAAKGTVPQESCSSCPGATCTASPKSTIVTRLFASIIMFLNFRSRWHT